MVGVRPARRLVTSGSTERRILRAGSLEASLEGADLVGIRWGATEIASRVFVTVRDAAWRTLPARPLDLSVEERSEGFTVEIEAEHSEGGGAFVWRGRFDGQADGTLACSVAVSATRDLDVRRVGICVLHPWAGCVGAGYTASGAGPPVEGLISREIFPQRMVGGDLQPMIAAFTSLELRLASGVGVSLTLEGEEFELEDQRNWSDASFKTYPTPLARSFPRTIRAGQEVRQSCVLSVSGPATPAATDGGPVSVRIGDATGTTMPDLGITAPAPDVAGVTLDALRAIRPAHGRVELVPSRDEAKTSAEALDTASAIGVPLELALLLDDVDLELDAVAALVGGLDVARVLVHRLDGRTTPAPVIARARERLALHGVPFAGGTASHFSEVNRDPPAADRLDAVAVAISAEVHMADERSIVETLEVQPQIVAQLRTMTAGTPVVVTPVTLAPREPGVDADIDPRVRSPFAGAWTAASAGRLAEAGAASVTFHERADDTLAELDSASGLTPAGEVLASLASFRGLDVVRLESSDPRRVFGVATRDGDAFLALVANLTSVPTTIALEAAAAADAFELDGFEVRTFEIRRGAISQRPPWAPPSSAGPSR